MSGETHRRVEILVDTPLVRIVTGIADRAGVTGYTLLPTLGGRGTGGRWSDDQVSGAEAKVMFVSVMTEATAAALAEAMTPLLESHGLIMMTSPVEVVRKGRF